MPYRIGWGDNQGRDIGALANGLRQFGEDVDFIVLDNRTELSTNEVRCASIAELTNPYWWSEQGCGVLLTIYGTRNMLPIYQAARKSSWKIWARMDCDGVPGPSGGLKKYIYSKVTESIDLHRRKRNCSIHRAFLGRAIGIARGMAGCVMSYTVNRRLLKSFDVIDQIMVETNLSHQSFQKYFHNVGRPELVDRLKVVPPAISEKFHRGPDVQKTKSVVATGQWWRYQKNMEFLCKVIATSIRKFPEISWHVAGGGSELVARQLTSAGVRLEENQVQCHKHLPPDQLNKINQTARIIFYSSRQEGFPNTLCEALCCGASFVAPRGIQAFDFCASQKLGTTYEPENLQSALESIEKEMSLWDSNVRSPDEISQVCQKQFHRKFVAERLINLRESMPL